MLLFFKWHNYRILLINAQVGRSLPYLAICKKTVNSKLKRRAEKENCSHELNHHWSRETFTQNIINSQPAAKDFVFHDCQCLLQFWQQNRLVLSTTYKKSLLVNCNTVVSLTNTYSQFTNHVVYFFIFIKRRVNVSFILACFLISSLTF